MSARIFSYPVEFLPGSNAPKQPDIFEAAQKFCEEQFGKRLDLSTPSMKTWVVLKLEDGDAKVIALSQFRRVLDIPTFHVAEAVDMGDKEADEAGKQEARNARDLLTSRMWGYAQDSFGARQEVMVFIDPATERYWKAYLRMIGAKPGNRYILNV